MNCNACGTQLDEGAANCFQCGAATETAPNDPTVMSVSSFVAQQPPVPTMYGSQPYGAALSSPYDSPSYGAASQLSYGPSPYQNPYEPYAVAQPARPSSPQGSGNRIGIIIGVVLVVLILIGGGVFALVGYSSARNAATAAANATASANAAQQHFTVRGNFTILSRTNISVRQDGQNKIYSYTQQGVDSGDITGSFTEEEISIVHPDNTANFSGTSTCTCTVAGKSGSFIYSYTGTSTANGSFQGQTFDGHGRGTGDLARLHGQGVFQGQGAHGTYSSELYFAI